MWTLVCFFMLFNQLFLNGIYAQTQTQTVSVTIGVGETILIINGKTTPNSLVTFKENNSIIGTVSSDNNGDFSKTFNPIDAGLHDIGVYSTDQDAKVTNTVNLSINVLANNTTTYNNLIIPSTINISDTVLNKGDILRVYGYAVPNSDITIFFFSSSVTASTTSSSSGAWEILFNTSSLDEGQNQVYSKVSVTGGYQSEISEKLSFVINGDGGDDDDDDDSDDDDDDDEIDQTQSNLLTNLRNGFGLFPKSPDNTGTNKAPSTGSNTGGSGCFLPRFLLLFDYDKNCHFIWPEFVDSAKSFVQLWVNKDNPTCDINKDKRCNLTDFSIILYYIDR